MRTTSWRRAPHVVLLVAVLAWLALPGLAQTPEASDDVHLSSVIVDGEVLFEIGGVSGLPASRRARSIRDRIVDIALDPAAPAIEVAVTPSAFGHVIAVGDTVILEVVQADADRERIGDTALIARIYAMRVEEAIASYRSGRSSAALQRGLIEGLVWTLGFFAFVALLFWINRRARRKVEDLVRRYMSAVEEATQEIVRARAIAEVIAVAAQGVLVALFFIALYYYVSVVLFAFAETRPLARLLLDYVSDPVVGALRAAVGFLPSLIVLVIIFFITRYLIRIARVTFENIEAGTVRIKGFRKHWVWPSFNLVRAILIVSAFILAYPYIPGSDSAAFQGMSILLGVMVSIGSNSVVSNVLAGLFVIYRQSTNVGDRIQIGDHIGEVVAIKLTETHLKSTKNELISIPNGQLLNSEVVNFSQRIDGRGIIVHVEVGIGYDEPQQKIEALLIEAARRTDNIKKSPAPFVLRKELGDFTVTYEINGFSNRGDIMPALLSELRANVLDVFHAAGVQIMSPHYEGDPETPKVPEVPAPEADSEAPAKPA